MPYIKNDRRVSISNGNVPVNCGELNFTVTNLINNFITEKGKLNYNNLNEVIGVLECAKLELYRRVAAPYEDKKRAENGDVYNNVAREKIYLATPYTGTMEQRERRFQTVNMATAILIKKGYIVFSPISQSHPIALKHDLPHTWSFWEEFDTSFISWADRVFVLKQDGWKESTGVQAEINIATNLKKPISYYCIKGENLVKDTD